jgi:hypothetical protein
VKRHTHQRGSGPDPVSIYQQCPLGGEGYIQGLRSGGKRGAEGISHRLEDVAPWASMTLHRISSWRARAARIVAGLSSHILLEPSMSVNRKVTVPLGGATTLGLPFPRRASLLLEL